MSCDVRLGDRPICPREDTVRAEAICVHEHIEVFNLCSTESHGQLYCIDCYKVGCVPCPVDVRILND